MFRSYSYIIIRERMNLCLLKLQLLKYSIKIHLCMLNTLVVYYNQTVQQTDTNEDLIYAATPPLY